MRAILAYAPAIVLLGVGIATVVAVPPLTQYDLVRCETLGGAPPGICSSTEAYSVNYLGVTVLLATGVAGLAYTLIVHRRRARDISAASRGLPEVCGSEEDASRIDP